MPRDDLARRLRRALEPEQQPEPEVSPTTPLAQLRHLATHGSTDNVRLQAARLLLEREEAAKASRAQRPQDAVQVYLAGLTDAEVDALYDGHLAADLPALVDDLLAGGPLAVQLPATAAALEAEIAGRTEARVAALADPAAREREIAERAEALAEELYRARAFKAVVADDAQLAAEAADGPSQTPAAADAPRQPPPLPPGLTQEDLQRPWVANHGSIFRPGRG